LRSAKNLHKVADTDFLLPHEVQESKSGVVAECLEEAFHIESLSHCHFSNIYALTYLLIINIVA
jgi:hypothetical protein